MDFKAADREIYGQVAERLVRYAQVDTQSQPYSGSWPTTDKQRNLAVMLRDELTELGASGIYYDEKNCVLYAAIPSNLPEGQGTPIALVTHMDTAPDASGTDVKPWILKNYDGGDIVLNKEQNIVMKAADYANLRQYIGQDLILTDGTTLLGGDDKASIAAVMTLAAWYCAHPEEPHAEIDLVFTPDEEVGGLAKDVDLSRLTAKVAYTLDGDHLGWYEDETFYASEAKLTVEGRSVHTGTAKGIMVNAADIAGEFLAMLPPREKPQYTAGIEGFYHVISCNAACEHAEVRLIIRDFDKAHFTAREAFLRECAERLADVYGKDRVSLTIHHQYSNMKEVLQQVPWLTETLRKAIEDSGITPVCEPFRGGTDGAALTFRGLPCPNLSAGYENAHGRFEYVPIPSMVRNVEILRRLCAAFAARESRM
ncbi:MAG: peptidase T [Firmicutes bacterium]|nr:peptidase T [Bacillota bacterium]